MRRKVIFALIFALLFVPAVAAWDINVRTLPNHKVSVSVLDPGYVYSLLDSAHIQAGSTGEITATYGGTKSEVKLLVKITLDGDQVLLHKFDDSFSTSENVYLQVIPGDISADYRELDAAKVAEEEAAAAAAAAAEQVNESEDVSGEDVSIDESEPSESAGTTGSVTGIVSGIKGALGGAFNIAIIVVVALGILVFVGRKYVGRGHASSTIKGIIKGQRESAETGSYEDRISRAEERLKDAQKEFEGLKNHSKIAAAEKKLEEDREALEKLKSGED